MYSTNGGGSRAAPGELGPGFLLPGTWAAGPSFPVVGTNSQGCPDAPGVMMATGNILIATGVANTFNGPMNFFEFNYVSNTLTQVNGPTGLSFNAAPYYTKFLSLPDGNVLWNYGNPQLYIYKPSGPPLAAGKPAVSNITENLDGSYHLTGTGLNGISEGAAYGDDAQMASNFPLVRMTNATSGYVYYARTFNWTSTGVMTSNTLVSTEFALPPSLPNGTYSLVVVANGICSDPVPFTTPLTAPVITSVATSGSDVVLSCTNGLAGRTYFLLTSADLTLGLGQWTPISTNYLGVGGSFSVTVTNTVTADPGQEFYMLQAQ